MDIPSWVLEMEDAKIVFFYDEKEDATICALLKKEWGESIAFRYKDAQMTGGTCEVGGKGHEFLLQILSNWELPGGRLLDNSIISNHLLNLFKQQFDTFYHKQ